MSHSDGASGLGLDGLFGKGGNRLAELVYDDDVNDIRINDRRNVYYTVESRKLEQRRVSEEIFPTEESYMSALQWLVSLTDLDIDLGECSMPVVEGGFLPRRSNLRGSVILLSPRISPTGWSAVVRKQRMDHISLDAMYDAGMMALDMRVFLESAVVGRANILISGASGIGKTTLMRALAGFVPPSHRMVTLEDAEELHLEDCGVSNLVSLVSGGSAAAGSAGSVPLEGLVQYALRMRPDRIWVGEVRGPEVHALTKACLSGHEGTVTTMHSNTADVALSQLTSYAAEAGLSESLAAVQVLRAFHLVVQLGTSPSGRRVVSEVREFLPTAEAQGAQQRHTLWRRDRTHDEFVSVNRPSPQLVSHCRTHGVDLDKTMAGLHNYGVG